MDGLRLQCSKPFVECHPSRRGVPGLRPENCNVVTPAVAMVVFISQIYLAFVFWMFQDIRESIVLLESVPPWIGHCVRHAIIRREIEHGWTTHEVAFFS